MSREAFADFVTRELAKRPSYRVTDGASVRGADELTILFVVRRGLSTHLFALDVGNFGRPYAQIYAEWTVVMDGSDVMFGRADDVPNAGCVSAPAPRPDVVARLRKALEGRIDMNLRSAVHHARQGDYAAERDCITRAKTYETMLLDLPEG